MIFAIDARVLVPPQATANLFLEINEAALKSGGKQRHLEISALTDLQKVELATEVGKAAALDYLKSDPEFSSLPVQRFVDFNLTEPQTFISIQPPSSKVLPNGSKVWRLAETEADKVRSKPLSG